MPDVHDFEGSFEETRRGQKLKYAMSNALVRSDGAEDLMEKRRGPRHSLDKQ